MEKFKPLIPLRVGFTAYVAVVALGLMSYVFYKAVLTSMFVSGVIGVFYFGMVLMLAIWSGIAYRSNNGNVISFSHSFLAIYIVFAFCITGNLFATVLINKLIDRDFPRKSYQMTVDRAKAEMKQMNKTDEQQKEELAQITLDQFDPPYSMLARNFAIMLAGAAIFSLLIAMFIKRSSEDLIRMNEKNTIQG